jgi:hypothetical protein
MQGNGAMTRARQTTTEEFTDAEADQRMLDLVRRSLATPHKPQKDFVGKTPRAKELARRRKIKGSAASGE